MVPLIDSPAFVRALEELKEAMAHMPTDSLDLSPGEVFRRFRNGRSAMAIAWPSPSFANDDGSDPTAFPSMSVAQCPGSDIYYRSFRKRWLSRPAGESVHVPLLGVDGRIGSVARESRHADAAFQLINWLSGAETSTKVFSRHAACAPFRRSHLANPTSWLPDRFPDDLAHAYADTVLEADEIPLYLICPRIPGHERYMRALDEEVHQALTGKKSPEQALGQAAQQWREITESLGIDSQREALQHHLGRGDYGL